MVFCLFRFNRNIESLCFGIEAKQPKQSVSKQTEKNRKKWKKPKKPGNPKFSVKNCKICSLSNCFGRSSVCFRSIETSKLSVLVKKRNNRNKRFVSDSAETSFCSSFGCFKSKLVSKDTLVLNASWSSSLIYDASHAAVEQYHTVRTWSGCLINARWNRRKWHNGAKQHQITEYFTPPFHPFSFWQDGTIPEKSLSLL